MKRFEIKEDYDKQYENCRKTLKQLLESLQIQGTLNPSQINQLESTLNTLHDLVRKKFHPAAYLLATTYESGRLVTPDRFIAEQYYHLALQSQLLIVRRKALNNLGIIASEKARSLSEENLPVFREIIALYESQAAKFFLEAKNLGYPLAAENLNILLTSSSIAQQQSNPDDINPKSTQHSTWGLAQKKKKTEKNPVIETKPHEEFLPRVINP
jgi:hypothetical protein